MVAGCECAFLQPHTQIGQYFIEKEKARRKGKKENYACPPEKAPAKITKRMAGTAKLHRAAMAIVDRYR